jgi:hypothetical protein
VYVVDLCAYTKKFDTGLEFYKSCQADLSLKIWKKCQTNIHVVFTKIDLFRENIINDPLKGYFPEYEIGQELDFIADLFKTNTKSGLTFYCYYVNCLDIGTVENCVQSMLDRQFVSAPMAKSYLENRDFYKRGVYYKIPPEYIFGQKIGRMRGKDMHFEFE